MKHVRLFNRDDNFSHTVELTDEELTRLLRPAVAKRLPIDGATVDETLLEELLDRPHKNGVRRVDCKIEMV